MSAVVVMPTRLSDEHRTRAYDFVNDRLLLDGWPVIAGGDEPGPWRKGGAVRTLVAEAERWARDPVVIVHDADVVLDLTALRDAVGAVESGAAEWAIPHTLVKRLTEHMTAAVYQGMWAEEPDLMRWPYIGIAGGGCTVLRASTYHDCPIDPRFVGWGEEDQSWGFALSTLHGEPWRATADLWHLWHPPDPDSRGGRSMNRQSNMLRRAYRAYRGEPGPMRTLLDAAR